MSWSKRCGYDCVMYGWERRTHAREPLMKHRKHMDDTKTGVSRRLRDRRPPIVAAQSERCGRQRDRRMQLHIHSAPIPGQPTSPSKRSGRQTRSRALADPRMRPAQWTLSPACVSTWLDRCLGSGRSAPSASMNGFRDDPQGFYRWRGRDDRPTHPPEAGAST
jgi:hypothetical protein